MNRRNYSQADVVIFAVFSLLLGLLALAMCSNLAFAAQVTSIDPNQPDSHCASTTATKCTCTDVVSGGTCATSSCPGAELCVPAPLTSSAQRTNWTTAYSDINELKNRDPNTPAPNAVAVYTGSGHNSVDSTQCFINSAGTSTFQCAAGILGAINSTSPAVWAFQNSTGPALQVQGGSGTLMFGTATTPAEVHLREAWNNGTNEVVLKPAASMSADHTINFTSTGLIPVADISGAITGPGSSTDKGLVSWNGTGGTALLNNSGWTFPATNTLAGSCSSSGSTQCLGTTQTSTGNIAKFISGSNSLTIENGAGLTIGANNTTGMIAGVQANATGDLMSLSNSGGDGFQVKNKGSVLIAPSDPNNPALKITPSNATANIVTITATDPNGTDAILPSGGALFTNASSGAVVGLAVTQKNASTSVATFTASDPNAVTTINKSGDVSIVGVTNSGHPAALDVTQNDSSGQIINAEGFDVLSDSRTAIATTSASTAFTVSQLGAGDLATFADGISGGHFDVMNGGGIEAVNDSAANQAALTVTQNHATAAIINAEGFNVLSDSRVTVTANSGSTALVASNSGVGDVANFSGASSSHVTVTANTVLQVAAVDNSSSALVVTQTGSGPLASITEVGANGAVAIAHTGATTITNDSGGAVTGFNVVQKNTSGVPIADFSQDKVAAGLTSASFQVYHSDLQTANGSAATLWNPAIPSKEVWFISALVSGRRTDTGTQSAGYRIDATVKDVSGTATLVGTVNAISTMEDDAAWDATINVSGATPRIRVTGVAAETIQWSATVMVSRLLVP